MSITKAHLSYSIHNQLGLPQNQSVKVLESILEIIKKTLENDEDVLIIKKKDRKVKYQLEGIHRSLKKLLKTLRISPDNLRPNINLSDYT